MSILVSIYAVSISLFQLIVECKNNAKRLLLCKKESAQKQNLAIFSKKLIILCFLKDCF